MRERNRDGFGIYPRLGLYVVVDANFDSRPVALTLEAFRGVVGEALLRHGSEGVLTTAGRLANSRVLAEVEGNRELRGVCAQFAALWLEEEVAHVAWSGSCQVYRVRDDEVELLTDDRQPSPHSGSIGCDEFEMFERFTSVEAGDTFVLATDGFLEHVINLESRRLFVCGTEGRPYDLHLVDLRRTPVIQLAETLLELASWPDALADDDVAVVCARVDDAPPRLLGQTAMELCARERIDGFRLRALRRRGTDGPLGAPQPRLVL